MIYLVAGLVLFLGLHLTRVFAEGWRTQRIAAWGANGWKGFNSLLSIIGFALICYGTRGPAGTHRPVDATS
jgi:uncharacterized membrane protein